MLIHSDADSPFFFVWHFTNRYGTSVWSSAWARGANIEDSRRSQKNCQLGANSHLAA
jgi:hypothetical protein